MAADYIVTFNSNKIIYTKYLVLFDLLRTMKNLKLAKSYKGKLKL